ncbi:lysophospholipase [Flavobacterium sp. LM5]|uniref:SGNH/GDSL hydrolase family protein n=1 Tax=Flavobacterium sp. LM5 TaxID=1938610 RepID=UPI000992D577|nr:SGNH/GDSL hydrolase family protein [Flavobacterium sp. LM5]OOV28419.1 lysophospholipase [Flavobacterium sp. LM5]
MEHFSKHIKTALQLFILIVVVLFFNQCSSENTTLVPQPESSPAPQLQPVNKKVSYIALGDSYTIGQSVCLTCRFPEQLKKKLETTIPGLTVDLKIIAQTGWTTSNLINAIKEQQPTTDYNLVTLLIGVNNQYQNREFSLYEREFPQLTQTAIALAKGNKDNVIVISIPDYAYTPFGQQFGTPTKISTEIDRYNAFAKSYCDANGITFINITDITRQGLKETYLVATDGLHPSEKAYSLFVDRIAPKAKVVVQK